MGWRWLLTHIDPSMAGEPVVPILSSPFDGELALSFVIYALMVPLQEVAIRGSMQSSLFAILRGSRLKRHLVAIVVSNLVFGIFHLNFTFAYAAVAAGFGLLWGAIYARQGSLVGATVSHILVGLWGLWVLDFGGWMQGLP